MDMTSEWLEEMLEDEFSDMCAIKFPLVSMGGRANPSSMRRRGVWTPISASGNIVEKITICQILGFFNGLCENAIKHVQVTD